MLVMECVTLVTKSEEGVSPLNFFISYRFYIGWSELASWKLIKMYQNINQFPFFSTRL